MNYFTLKARFSMLKLVLLIFVLLLVSTLFIHKWVQFKTKAFVYDSIQHIPSKQVGLVLGTSKYLKNGRLNWYFTYRIEAAVELWKAGKVHYLLVSGDNSKDLYNEPLDMLNALVKAGVPRERIEMDFAGLRTLDSMVRAKKIFGQQSFIVISQRFHNERAVYYARNQGIDVYGFNAKDVSAWFGFKTQIREWLARDKMMLDIALGVEPRFLGDPILIE